MAQLTRHNVRRPRSEGDEPAQDSQLRLLPWCTAMHDSLREMAANVTPSANTTDEIVGDIVMPHSLYHAICVPLTSNRPSRLHSWQLWS
jgi:hypothetical protein